MSNAQIFADLTQWVLSLATSYWVLVPIFVMPLIDGFFPPIPSESILISLGALSAAGHAVPLWSIFLVGALGALCGDIIAYEAGRRLPIARWKFFSQGVGKRAYERAAHALHKRGTLYIFSARFIPVGRVAVNVAAGTTGFPRGRFLRTDAIAVIAWAAYSVSMGFGAGAVLHKNPILAVVVGVCGGVLMGMVLDKLVTWFLERRQEKTPENQ